MTHDERFPDEDFEDDAEEVLIAPNPGIIAQVRFERHEFRELSAEEEATGRSSIDLIHDYALATIRANQAARAAGQAEVAD